MISKSGSYDDIVNVNTLFGDFFAPRGDLITQQLQEYGAHTRNELAMVLDHIEYGSVVVDIGAHIGTFAVPIGKKIGSSGRVLCIEAHKPNFDLLVRNVGANGLVRNVQCKNCILGEKSSGNFGHREIADNSGAGFYEPDEFGSAVTDASALLSVSGFAIPDFVKIDIEGMEGSVLRSLRPILEACRPKLYIEVVKHQLDRYGDSPASLQRTLSGLGYRFFRNVGDRNSSDNIYRMERLSSLNDGGDFFDVLALT